MAGGIALKTYGVHLLGQEIDLRGNISMEVYGQVRVLRNVDNGYIYSLIQYGALYTVTKLIILSFVHAKCLRTGNRRVLLLSIVMLILERNSAKQ